jgi:hypothetical protein
LIEDTDTSIAAGLTQLTQLRIESEQEIVGKCLGHITGCTQLQDLEMRDATDEDSVEPVLTPILTSLRQLTSLTTNYMIQQDGFDALLTHAPQLASITCRSLVLIEDRSAMPCSWQELVMSHQVFDAESVAYIPTGSLTRLAFEDGDAEFPSPCPVLKFTSQGIADPENMLDIVRRSLLNLMRCPAWQQCGPEVHVCLGLSRRDGDGPEQLDLLRTLAPLVSKEVKLSLDMPEAAVGAPDVQQLGATLGSSLKQLMLEECVLAWDFWSAVWAHLPGLQQLGVGGLVRGATGVHGLATFCSCATRPLQLSLGQRLYTQVEGRLDQEGRWMGVPHVTVTEEMET